MLLDLVKRLISKRLERHVLKACCRGELTSVLGINKQRFNARLLGTHNERKRANVVVLVAAHKKERIVHEDAASADAPRAWHALQICEERCEIIKRGGRRKAQRPLHEPSGALSASIAPATAECLSSNNNKRLTRNCALNAPIMRVCCTSSSSSICAHNNSMHVLRMRESQCLLSALFLFSRHYLSTQTTPATLGIFGKQSALFASTTRLPLA